MGLSLIYGEEMFEITEAVLGLERCGVSSRRDSMHKGESVKCNADDIIRKEFFSGETTWRIRT